LHELYEPVIEPPPAQPCGPPLRHARHRPPLLPAGGHGFTRAAARRTAAADYAERRPRITRMDADGSARVPVRSVRAAEPRGWTQAVALRELGRAHLAVIPRAPSAALRVNAATGDLLCV